MHYGRELEFLRKTLNRCNINNTILENNTNFQRNTDSDVINILLKQSVDSLSDFFQKIESNTIYTVTDAFSCRYILLYLSEAEGKIFVIGPYFSSFISNQQLLKKCERYGILHSDMKNLSHYFSKLPVISDERSIIALVAGFAEVLWNGIDNYRFHELGIENPLILTGNLKISDNQNDNMSSIRSMEARYDFENKLMDAVSCGNIIKAEEMLSSISNLAFESRSSDELRNMKNYCIIMNTLFRKAAEYGGVHPVYLDSVSSDFAKRIETLSSVSQTMNFMNEILRAYCRLVRKNKIKNFSPLVQKALILIESDLTSDLSLREISRINNVSTSYFSTLFKNETGFTLTEYVNNKRISLAKQLLKDTNLQIQTIAQHCGILDLHYFCRVFKKLTGMTPSSFRESLPFE